MYNLKNPIVKNDCWFQITCHNSGGHVNPAVTVLSLFFKKLSIPMAILYIVAQLIGGILGFGLIKVNFAFFD